MPAVKILPANYETGKVLDLSSSSAALWLNIAAIPLLIVYSWLFSLIFSSLQPANALPNGLWSLFTLFSFRDWFILLLCIILIMLFHELIHGLFFWIFIKERPRFGLRGGYAFASAPDWFIPKYQYIAVGLSPFVMISILAILVSAFLPARLLPYLLLVAAFNAAGALGDMIVVAWMLTLTNSILVRDQGDKFLTYDLSSD